MKALQSLSFNLKTKHPGTRRNILFDDEVLSLALDVSLGEGQPWRRVSAAQARTRMKKLSSKPGSSQFALGDNELDDILGQEEAST